jgi:hypothetical protein
MPTRQSIDDLIAKKAVEYSDQIKAAAMADNEEEIRIESEKQLAFIQKDAGIKLEGKHEFTIAKGRIDSVYSRVIIEYKNPKSPGDRIGQKADSPGCKKVVEQIKRRFGRNAQVFGAMRFYWFRRGFFQALARYLAQSLGMDYVCIDRLDGNLQTAQTVAVFFEGKFEDNVSYTLKDTPCGDVVGKSICCFPRDVRNLFPKDKVLNNLLAESYVGTTLLSSQGQPIGLIAIIGRKPITEPSWLRLFYNLWPCVRPVNWSAGRRRGN